MKKILFATLCIAALGLSACDKTVKDNSTTTSTVETVKQSTNTPADIKADLAKIDILSAPKISEAMDFQSKVTQAKSKNDKAALEQLLKEMKTFIEGFNQELDALELKSTEVGEVRKLMKDTNLLYIELTKEGVSSKPSIDKINELSKKAAETQKELVKQMTVLKQKTSETK